MKGIKMKDCRFYVNKEARTVICVIPKTKYKLINFIQDHFRWDDFDVYYSMTNDKLLMPHSFKGKAICSKDDEWNEDLGRMIAFSRAKDKYYKSFFKRANMLVQLIDQRLGNMITMFNDMGMKLENNKEKLDNKINQLIKE